ncbi:unnamed protein product [Ascophyllum nodosum]
MFGDAGMITTEYCTKHAPDGMVNVCSRKCGTEGCRKRPSFGVAGTKTTLYCAQHARDGMVDVYIEKCRTESCGNQASFAVAGTKTPEYLGQHAPDGVVDACSRKCTTGDCSKKPSIEVTNAKMAEYCAKHAMLNCGVEGYREGEVGPHNSGKKTTGSVIRNGAKLKAINLPPTETSPTSDGRRGSRKRERPPEMTPTASKRAVLRESSGVVAETMPEIDGQKPPVKRNSSVKAEVQLSL